MLDEGLPLHPLQIQKETVRDYRQIGLGIMGLADMLINMDITYGSQESISLCDRIGHTLACNAIIASNELADKPYPKFTKDIFKSAFYQNHNTLTEVEKIKGLRNSQLLTIAPTGSISTMWNISGGIEPIFAKYYTRTTKSLHGKDKTYKVYPKIIEDFMKEYNITDVNMLPSWFVSSEDIDWDDRLNMQAVWQKHIDASIKFLVAY